MVNLWPGTRVRVFDTSLYRDDKSTPPEITMRLATVVCWRGHKSDAIDQPGVFWTYDNLVDVRFDHRPDLVSRSHFAYWVEVIT